VAGVDRWCRRRCKLLACDASRNGYRHRDFDTRAGTLDVAIPKLRSGNYFPDWLLERRRHAERALTTVVATCCLLGVSTRPAA
jgi:transposase-like protein